MKIVIEEKETGETTLKADKGIKWSTFITAIEMLIEVLEENCPIEIDSILDDIKRIYERDKKKNEINNKNTL